MKTAILYSFFLVSFSTVFSQKPVNIIFTHPKYADTNISPNTFFGGILPTGTADSALFEIDTSTSFNSPKLISLMNRTRGSSWYYRDILFRLNTKYYCRARAFANNNTAGNWTTSFFTTRNNVDIYANNSSNNLFSNWKAEFSIINIGYNAQIQVSDSPIFKTIIHESTIVPIDSPLRDFSYQLSLYGLKRQQKYYIRARPFDKHDTGEWKTLFFYINFTPILTSGPDKYDLYVNINIGSRATTSPDSNYIYEYQIAKNTNFTGADIYKFWDFSKPLPVPLWAGTTNYVRYRVYYQNEISEWSTTWMITSPNKVSLPLNIYKDSGLQFVAMYLPEYCNLFQYQIDTSTNFNTSKLITIDSNTFNVSYSRYTYLRLSDFAKYKNCYVRYRYGNSKGWIPLWSNPSIKLFNLYIKPNVPGSTNYDFNQELVVSDSFYKPAYYEIQCDIDSNFRSSKLITQKYNKWYYVFIFDDLWYQPKFCYRLRAVDKLGRASSWSNILYMNNSFPMIITFPKSGDNVQKGDKYVLGYFNGAKYLKYQIGLDKSFSRVWGTFKEANDPQYNQELIYPLSYTGTLYTRFMWVNNRDSTPWSNVIDFHVNSLGNYLTKPILLLPLNYSSKINSKKIVFSWNSSPGATQYLLEITNNKTKSIYFADFTGHTYMEVNDLPPNETFTWRVLPLGGLKSLEFSESFTFSTDNSTYGLNSKSVYANTYIIPNPATSYFIVSNMIQYQHIALYDYSGKFIQRFEPTTDNKFNTTDIPNGFYILHIKQSNGNILKSKLLISH